jgi:hypothetical protein
MGTVDYFEDPDKDIKEKRYVPIFPHMYSVQTDPDSSPV